jgi:hypothetical protein
MNEQQILNATIYIEEVVDKGKKLSIKGNDGNRTSTYSIWKSKQDGSDSQPYQQWKSMGLQVGRSVFIGYVIDEYTTQISGFDKRVQSKKIINLREPSAGTSPTPALAKIPRYEPPTNAQSHSRDEFSRRLGIQGHLNALLSNPNYYGSGLEVTIRDLVREAIAIEDEAEKQVKPSQSRVAPEVIEEVPTIQIDEPPLSDEEVEGIPF